MRKVRRVSEENQTEKRRQQHPMSQVNPESLPIIADYGTKAVLRQLSEADTLTARGYQIAGFASVVLGLAAVTNKGGWLTGAIVLAYGFCLAVCLWVVRPRAYDSPGSPDDLWTWFYDETPAVLWHGIAERSAISYKTNARVAERRWKALTFALAALAIESLFLGVRLWAA